jgi:hypothetical protein
MRHKLTIAFEVLLIAAAVAAVYFIFKHPDRHDDKTSSQPPAAVTPKKALACQRYTLVDAKQLLGQSAKASTSPTADSNGGNLYTSSCTYTEQVLPGQQTSVKQSSTLIIRQPQSEKGVQSNQGEFGPLIPKDAQVIDGYGDKAFWDPERGELNILKADIWYEFSIGPTNPSERTLDQTKPMADLLLPKL